MAELATAIDPARKAPRPSERGHWVGAGRALAGEIWGINYVGTIPSYGVPVASPESVFPEGIPARGNVSVVVGAGSTRAFFSPSSLEDLYYGALRPLTSDIGVSVWAGEWLISLPAQAAPAPSAPDLVFWTSEGLGASSILIVAEPKISRTDPVDASHAPAWRRLFETLPIQRPAAERHPAITRDAHADLRTLAEWTRLPVEQLGELLGASRRTIYNWLSGRPIRDEAQSRILRFRDSISPVASSRDPALVRAWLLRGDPSPAALVAQERWDELESVVRHETAPVRPADEVLEHGLKEPHADAPEVLTAALLAFSNPPARTTIRRPDWKPREVTGIESESEEDAE
jgi:hypothetical protein